VVCFVRAFSTYIHLHRRVRGTRREARSVDRGSAEGRKPRKDHFSASAFQRLLRKISVRQYQWLKSHLTHLRPWPISLRSVRDSNQFVVFAFLLWPIEPARRQAAALHRPISMISVHPEHLWLKKDRPIPVFTRRVREAPRRGSIRRSALSAFSLWFESEFKNVYRESAERRNRGRAFSAFPLLRVSAMTFQISVHQ
jgi:hypothetical protein